MGDTYFQTYLDAIRSLPDKQILGEEWVIDPPNPDYGYDSTPNNALTFSIMGVDGVHYAILTIGGVVRDDSPAGWHVFAAPARRQLTDNSHRESMERTADGVLFSAGSHVFGVGTVRFSIPRAIAENMPPSRSMSQTCCRRLASISHMSGMQKGREIGSAGSIRRRRPANWNRFAGAYFAACRSAARNGPHESPWN